MSELRIKLKSGSWFDVGSNVKFEIVTSLPPIGVEGTIYLVLISNNNYSMHTYKSNKWLSIGGTAQLDNKGIIEGLGYTPINEDLLGASNGIAQLDANGKVIAAQLPSFVDDVMEYDTKEGFPIQGETGKIYVDKATNTTYRWSGTTYVSIGSDLALGETSSTAYAGDKGKANADKINAHVADSAIHVTSSDKTNWNNKYELPSGGIPKTTLAKEVQDSLDKANSAIQDVSDKQDVILDLAAIRSGAAAGATAIQEEQDPTVPLWAKQQNKPTYTAEEVGALPDTVTVPTQVSELENDANYISGNSVITGQIISFNPAAKTAEMTQPVGLDDVGKLWTAPSSIGEGYVTNTDYATKETGGVIKLDDSYGFALGNTGKALLAQQKSLTQYNSYSQYGVISKGTLENIKETLVKSVGDEIYQPAGDYALASDIPEVPSNTSDLNNDSGFVEAFYATYGTTSFDEITEAYNAGKLVLCVYNGRQYTFTGLYNEVMYQFIAIQNVSAYRVYCRNTDAWGSEYYTVATTSDIPTKISELENDIHVPQLNPISSLTVENYWNTKPAAASSNGNQWTGFFNLKIKPIDTSKSFRVKLGAQSWMPHWTTEKLTEVGLNPADYGNGGEANGYGYGRYRVDLLFYPQANKSYSTQITDAQYHTSTYRPLYYINFGYPKNDVDDGYVFGWSIYSAYQAYNTTQATFDKLKQVFDRTIVCEILELENCTYEWIEQTEYLAANFPNHTIGQVSIATQGRTQTGDVNQTDRGTSPMYKSNKGPATGYSLMFFTDEPNTVTALTTATANSTANTKVSTSNKINIWKGLWYYASSTARADKYSWAGGVFYSFYTSMDLRYSTNCSNNFLINQAGYDVYLIGQLDEDGWFKPVQIPRTISGKVYNIEVCDETYLPTEADGYVYVLIGQTVGTNRYSITLAPKHPIFKHNGTYMECIGIC